MPVYIGLAYKFLGFENGECSDWDLYVCVMGRYMMPNKIFNMKMKIYKPIHSYPTLTY